MNIIIISPQKILYTIQAAPKHWVMDFFKNFNAHKEEVDFVERYIAESIAQLTNHCGLKWSKTDLSQNCAQDIFFLPDSSYGQSYIDFYNKKIIQYNSYDTVSRFKILDIIVDLNPNIFTNNWQRNLRNFYHFVEHDFFNTEDNTDREKKFLVNYYNYAKPFIEQNEPIAKNKGLVDNLHESLLNYFSFAQKSGWLVQENNQDINTSFLLDIYLSLRAQHNVSFTHSFIKTMLAKYEDQLLGSQVSKFLELKEHLISGCEKQQLDTFLDKNHNGGVTYKI